MKAGEVIAGKGKILAKKKFCGRKNEMTGVLRLRRDFV